MNFSPPTKIGLESREKEQRLAEKIQLLDAKNTETGSVSSQGGVESEYEERLSLATSSLVSSKPMQNTDEYEKIVGIERPVGVFFYGLFLILSPLVFRYAMYSCVTYSTPSNGNRFLDTGNASLSLATTWGCSACSGIPGVTLSELTVNVKNITGPNFIAGIPSIAVFATQDFKTWYNYYTAPSIDAPYIKNWFDNTMVINQTNGAACLGNIYNNYLVACLNVRNLANKLKLGQTVKGPPFNDRCFQVEGICGVPCSSLEGGQSPPLCTSDGTLPKKLLVINATVVNDDVTELTGWGSTFNMWDWIVLITVFLDTLGNFMRFLPLLSGRPSDVESSKSVQCSGTAVLGCSTPIVSENEAIFLRGLVGRTLTALHTIGSRHVIKGLYLDTIINEFRGKNEERRTQQWCAWIQFCEVLAGMKTRQMIWENNLSNNNDQPADKKPLGAGGKLIAMNNKDKRVIRTVRVRKDLTVQWDCGLANVKFEGVTAVKDPSYKEIPVVDRASLKKAEMSLRSKSFDFGSSAPEASVETDFGINNKNKAKLSFNLEDVLPLICFLDGWLEEIKNKEPTYNYRDKTQGLKSIFNDAPSQKYFYGDQLLEVQERLLLLFDIFNGDKVQPVPDDEGFVGYKRSPQDIPLHRDEITEVVWNVSRIGLPDVQLAWSYLSRARVKQNVVTEEDPFEQESTRIKKHAIVHLKVPDDVSGSNCLEKWFASRYETYKVTDIKRDVQGQILELTPWPVNKDIENQKKNGGIIHRPIESVSLIEKNRGKAGALNVYVEYLRLRAKSWAAINDVPYPCQTIAAIVDARHMLAEPHIYYNEALPYFSRLRKGKGTKKGLDNILVQYPQFFSNVKDDDYLDNKNSGYYTIWQTLRDCGKCITSSGTNAIWDVSDSSFSYATSSRIEDTGTSQKYLADYTSVHLPCFVAYGIAKETEDYIEAVYRWSTGAVELFWATLFSQQFTEFCVIGTVSFLYAMASFAPYSWAYFLWIAFIIGMAICGYWEKSNNLRPLRSFIVSSTIVMNTMYWISNLSSPVWAVIVPVRIAIFSSAPISSSPEQSLTWAFVSLILRFPIGIVTDRIITLARWLSPKTQKDKWNFSLVLWRSSQLYVCSFAYTLLSVIIGTQSAYRAKFKDGDNTMWSSFRVSSDQIGKAYKDMKKVKSCFSKEYISAVYTYNSLQFLRFRYSFLMPDVLTTYMATFLFTLQLVCIFVSVAVTNASKPSYIFTTIVVCGVNTFLVTDIAMLLMPFLGTIIGRPARLEYVFAILSAIIIISLLMNQTIHKFSYYTQVF